MKRFQGNPILEPDGTHRWESRRVFNAAVLRINKNNHILYRAMGQDGISRLGYATSSDGYNIDERLSLPAFEPANDTEKDGCEDPRLTLLDDTLVMAYTAFRNYGYQGVYQVSLTSINIKDFLSKRWTWGERLLAFPGIRNKDAMIFTRKLGGEYVMFHRLEPDICIARSDDLRKWYGLKFVMGPRMRSWDSWKVGAAGPPIELNEGWLFIYHGVSFEKIYSLGAALLDRNNPEEILYRSEEPILTPVEDYERFGKVPNVVFSCGSVLMDDKVLVYYGGADSVLCAATYDLSELLPKK
ncbi:MAG: glycosidase [Candidatus Bathyarchaeota archaeon]|nr:glycosidase [Candidatus Bathyarchaeota archaeon]